MPGSRIEQAPAPEDTAPLTVADSTASSASAAICRARASTIRATAR
ncbi:hypothetical protein [Actinomyces johnsonii]|nr:hypothetical protein [Actinomyces johnsonii]